FAGVLREALPTFVELNELFPAARAFAREVRPALHEAPATLRLANPLLAQLQGLLSPPELPELIRVGDPAIRSLARLQPPLRTLLELLYPVTECARRNVLPPGKSIIKDGDHTAPYPVYSELFHGWVGLASAVQNFDGNGQALRYHAGFGDQTITTGQVSGLTEPLVAITENKILGSRPRKPSTGLPPFKPKVPCITQKPPNLQAATGQGQTVDVAGVQVGDIGGVTLKNGIAVVRMNLTSGDLGHVYRNAHLQLRPKTGLNDMAIEMDPGHPDPALPDGGRLHEGDTLP